MSSILNQFDIFQPLSDEFKNSVTKFHIFKNFDYESNAFALILCENRVLVLGYNVFGLGSDCDANGCKLVPELCDKGIVEIYDGRNGEVNCMFARNDKNQVYAWGQNLWGQLIRGHRRDFTGTYLKPDRIEFFDDKCIVQIVIGDYHCLALTAHGEIYAWGDNKNGQLGCADSQVEFSLTPIKLGGEHGIKHKIKWIYSTKLICFAVTDNGPVYSWGFNGSQCLGQNSGQTFYFAPSLIDDIQDVVKVEHHDFNTFFLCKNGLVFSCGQTFGPKITKIESEFIYKDIYRNYFQSEECVHVFHQDKLKVEKSAWINYFDYFMREFNLTHKTTQVTKDGFIVNKVISCNENYQDESNEKLLNEMDYYIYSAVNKFNKNFADRKYFGSGGYGKVYIARNALDGQEFAIKKIWIEIEDSKSEYFSEIRFLSELNSDFVVNFITAWIEFNRSGIPEFLFIQMEFCSQSLKDILELKAQAFGRLANERLNSLEYFISCHLLRELTECVNYLHSFEKRYLSMDSDSFESDPVTPKYIEKFQQRPFIHRDLKPANVLVSDGTNGRFLKLCDFGLMKEFASSDNTGNVGTDAYKAPDVTRCENCNLKADVYSLGVIGQQIFGVSLDEDFNYSEPILDKLLTKLRQLFRQMTDEMSDKRPNCEEVTQELNDISLIKNQIKTIDNFDSQMNLLKQFDNQFFFDYAVVKLQDSEYSKTIEAFLKTIEHDALGKSVQKQIDPNEHQEGAENYTDLNVKGERIRRNQEWPSQVYQQNNMSKVKEYFSSPSEIIVYCTRLIMELSVCFNQDGDQIKTDFKRISRILNKNHEEIQTLRDFIAGIDIIEYKYRNNFEVNDEIQSKLNIILLKFYKPCNTSKEGSLYNAISILLFENQDYSVLIRLLTFFAYFELRKDFEFICQTINTNYQANLLAICTNTNTNIVYRDNIIAINTAIKRPIYVYIGFIEQDKTISYFQDDNAHFLQFSEEYMKKLQSQNKIPPWTNSNMITMQSSIRPICMHMIDCKFTAIVPVCDSDPVIYDYMLDKNDIQWTFSHKELEKLVNYYKRK